MSKKQTPPTEIPNTKQPAEIDPVDPTEIEDPMDDDPEIEPVETPDIEPSEPEISPAMPSDPEPEVQPSTPAPARPM